MFALLPANCIIPCTCLQHISFKTFLFTLCLSQYYCYNNRRSGPKNAPAIAAAAAAIAAPSFILSAIGPLLVRRDPEMMHLLYQRSDGSLKYVRSNYRWTPLQSICELFVVFLFKYRTKVETVLFQRLVPIATSPVILPIYTRFRVKRFEIRTL